MGTNFGVNHIRHPQPVPESSLPGVLVVGDYYILVVMMLRPMIHSLLPPDCPTQSKLDRGVPSWKNKLYVQHPSTQRDDDYDKIMELKNLQPSLHTGKMLAKTKPNHNVNVTAGVLVFLLFLGVLSS